MCGRTINNLFGQHQKKVVWATQFGDEYFPDILGNQMRYITIMGMLHKWGNATPSVLGPGNVLGF